MAFGDVAKSVGKYLVGYGKRLGEEYGAGSQRKLDAARKATMSSASSDSKGKEPTEGKAPTFQPKAVGSASPDSFKRGGKVRKTGIAKVHKGERVLTKKQAKKYRKRG